MWPVQDLSHQSGGSIVPLCSKNQAGPSLRWVTVQIHISKMRPIIHIFSFHSGSLEESIDVIFDTGAVENHPVEGLITSHSSG